MLTASDNNRDGSSINIGNTSENQELPGSVLGTSSEASLSTSQSSYLLVSLCPLS
jgi:hypothetical protein